MRTTIRTALAAFCFLSGLLLSGCDKSDTAPVQPSERLWTVSGKAYLAGSTDPIPGVVVKCAGLSTESGADGSYEIRDVPWGTQLLVAEKRGYFNYSRQIEVNSDVKHNIYLDVRRTNLSGQVSNAVDGPIKGAKVTIHGLVNYTDISGHYNFMNMPQGSDSLRISHPSYSGFDTALTLSISEMQFDVALKRDSVFEVRSISASYVDEFFPNNVFYTDRLYLRSNGVDSLGRPQSGIRRYIYVSPTLPEILRREQVSVIEASLQMCTDGPFPPFSYEVFLITSTWNAPLTYNRRPEIGDLLQSSTNPGGSSSKYITVLNAETIVKLVSHFRSNLYLYGVMIQGGNVNPIGFFSARVVQNQPKMTFRIRY